MKKHSLLLLFFALVSTLVQAQIVTPAISPLGKVEQRIGLTDVSVEYSRPSKKGRVIFGDLVPFDQPWRTGANSATKITFSENVNFGGVEVPKGSYAMLSKPGKKAWTFMLYPHNATNFTTYLESDVQPIMVPAEAIMMPQGINVESLMMGFDNLKSTSGDFYLLWDNVYVPVAIKTNTDQTVEASITKTMSGPTAGDYYSAANYYLNNGKDLNKALEWVNKSIEMGNEKFWVLRAKSLIQAGLGDKKGAIVSATRSLELATEAKDTAYIKMNTESIAEWQRK
ncbi:MAG TPA: DUF2911 domain-containing protein [Saprospiraceae bacterium]|nr:DUF2911 domain-containing protein [Saprospiraceae bacterium]